MQEKKGKENKAGEEEDDDEGPKSERVKMTAERAELKSALNPIMKPYYPINHSSLCVCMCVCICCVCMCACRYIWHGAWKTVSDDPEFKDKLKGLWNGPYDCLCMAELDEGMWAHHTYHHHRNHRSSSSSSLCVCVSVHTCRGARGVEVHASKQASVLREAA
jgi:hypothetical protein